MGIIYVDTGATPGTGVTYNSGSSDTNSPKLSGDNGAATGCAVTGSTVQLPVGTDLSTVDATDGSATQDTIFINDATNTNQKVFWITAKDDGLDQVTVSVAPTGTITASDWSIGGRALWLPANTEAALRAGDIIQFNNSPATFSADLFTTRVAGTNVAPITLRGVAGSRPVLTVSNTNQVIECAASSSGWLIHNLELVQTGASGNVINESTSSLNHTLLNLKVSDGGGHAIFVSSANKLISNCELTGVAGSGISVSNAAGERAIIKGNNIHDVTTDGIVISSTIASQTIQGNVIDSCGGRGINLSAAIASGGNTWLVDGNTVYGCGNSGIEVADADNRVILTNNIFSENGNAAGEFNVEWVAGSAEGSSFHAWNVFFHSGGGGGANLSGLTVDAFVASSEFTTDPQFTNPGSADFSLGSSSPAKATGGPTQFLGGNANFLDIGAVQRQESTSGGGSNRVYGS